MGFPNSGVDCYRNVVFQMILHMPILYNWLAWYKNHHAPKGYVCNMGEHSSRCRVCQLAEIFQGYWANETESWIPTFKCLAREILLQWKPNGEHSEQDPSEYFYKVYNAIKESISPMMYVISIFPHAQKTDLGLQARRLRKYVRGRPHPDEAMCWGKPLCPKI